MTPEDQDCIAMLQDDLIYNDPLYQQGFQAGAASRDAEIARLKAIPVRYRRMAFNAQLQDEIAELVAALETVIANAPEPYCAITRAVDAQCRAALAKAGKVGYE